ncbi:MAG: hypothetical protein AAB706_02115 [Patescibacteria group bacterium]
MEDIFLQTEMERLLKEKKAALELRERKHEDWDGNYELYRNKVKTNRLTQRQAVNIPLMKETIKTLLSKIDDKPNVEWQELNGDEQKELYYQEIWNDFDTANNLELIDILDKKNVLLYGISFKKLNIGIKGITSSVLDPYDIAIDPLTLPWDIETARFLVNINIFRSVREILADDKYTKKGKDALKLWENSGEGITQSEKNKEEWEKKMERLKSMGVDSSDFQLFAGGDRIVNLTEHFTNVWNSSEKKFERRVVVYADDTIELLNEKLEDLIGVDFWPFEFWSEDPEINDIYPDSVADLIRTPNKVLNVWYSQMIENRTLRNFQMHWFLPMQGYTPQTYTPGPGVMLPAPPGEDINKVIKPVEISGLDDTLEAIAAITRIVERGTGATAIDKGQSEKGTQTLGEVEILVSKAGERATAMTKFYRISWYKFAQKWDALMQANAPKIIKLHKKGRSGKTYTQKVYASDWKSDYKPNVRSTSEQDQNNIQTIQKFQFLLNMFPNNPALRQVAQKRSLELVDVSPEELNEITEAEKQLAEQLQMQAQAQLAQPMQTQVNPAITGGGGRGIGGI